jgi:hypothetical protein
MMDKREGVGNDISYPPERLALSLEMVKRQGILNCDDG